MSQAIDSPIVVLFEDRPKQSMVLQLNLSVYLDARVTIATSLKDLKKVLGGPDGLHLVIVRSQFKGAPIAARVLEFLAASNAPVPVICMGDEKEQKGLTIVADGEIRPLLQTSAKFLGITAQQMVSKKRADTFEISPEFLNMLFTFPCDVFDHGAKGLEKVFSLGDTVPRSKIARYVAEKRSLVVDAFQRLKLANEVTTQSLKAAAELESALMPETKKMTILASSLDMVAAQFQNAGMDEETVKLANASIKAVEKIAESATSVGNLVRDLMKAEGGYRYSHCQLITFLGFHVIKMMGWWGDEQRAILSQAAFYHDISLSTDEQAKIRSQKDLSASPLKDAQFEELVLTHPQLAARELQTAPEISPEVVRVVIQHHGSPVGRGFSNDIAKLDNLAKTFILSEEWGDYLMELALTDQKPDNAGRLTILKALYKDDQSHQILETFRYLDPSEFAHDFLSTKEVDFAASLISGGGAGPEAESVVLAAGSEEPEPETVFKSDKPEEEVKRKITGVTDVRVDEEIHVKGEKAEKEKETRLKATKAAPKDETKTVFKREPKLADVARAPGATGDKARKLMDVIKTKKPNATPEEVETLLKAGGVALDETTVKMVADEEEEIARKFESVTEHIEHEEIHVKGEAAAAEVTQKIEGVTDVRVDEKITVKGDTAKDLVDRSITRIKGDVQEKERELKMKALAGSTDLMKAALSGALDKVTELVTASANPVGDLRKTDAEGRSVVHYAAMGGAVDVLKFLVEKGIQLNTADAKRRTPLFFAALYKQNDAFDFLLTQGGKINQQGMGGMTIAMVGAFSGNMHILKCAVERGVRIEAKDHSGKTALDFAKQSKNLEAIAFLEAALAPKPGAAGAGATGAAGAVKPEAA
ncbi:MAG: ankyrin repeat domain-containing protein [Bdellovibrionota bacterium]